MTICKLGRRNIELKKMFKRSNFKTTKSFITQIKKESELFRFDFAIMQNLMFT